MSWTTYLKNAVLDHIYNDPAYTAPSVYLAISSTAPAADGSNVTEPSGANYSRVQATTGAMSAAASGSKTNGSEITFPVPSGAWTATHLCGYDASSGGNLLWYIDVTDRSIVSGDTVKVPVGGLVHSL